MSKNKSLPPLEKNQEGREKPIIEGSPEDKKANSNSVELVLPSLGIKVVALGKGFFRQFRHKEFDVFFVGKRSQLGSWMKCLDPEEEKLHQKVMVEKKKMHRAWIAAK